MFSINGWFVTKHKKIQETPDTQQRNINLELK